MPLFTLLLLSFALAWTVFLRGGVWPSDWSVSLGVIGSASTGYWLFSRPTNRAPTMASWLGWLVFLLPCYVMFQLVPLPVGVLQILSPARSTLLLQLKPILPQVVSAPLTVSPPETVLGLFTILGYIATFLLVRELAWCFSTRPWVVALPIILIAAFEASLGMFQVFAKWPSGQATGTYTNRDHFAGFLEMVLPFALLFGLVIFRSTTYASNLSIRSALAVCAIWGIAALLLLSITYSLSRTGFVVALGVLLMVGAFSIIPRLPSRVWRWPSAGAIGMAIVLICILFPPDQLIKRFADASSSDDISGVTRVSIWKDTLPLIAEFRIFGCGLGGFEPAFLKHQTVTANYSIAFAHNDYLQYLAELGLIGFTLLGALVSGIAVQVVRTASKVADEPRRLLLIACAGGFLAMLVHSLVDFNTYVPANAMTLAWIAGLGSSIALERA